MSSRAQQAQTGEQLFRIRFQKSLGNNEGIKKLRDILKLDIARIKTVDPSAHSGRREGCHAPVVPTQHRQRAHAPPARKRRRTNHG